MSEINIPDAIHEASILLEQWMTQNGVRYVNGVCNRRCAERMEVEIDAMKGVHARLQEAHVRLSQKFVILEKEKHLSDMVVGLGRVLLEAQERRHKAFSSESARRDEVTVASMTS